MSTHARTDSATSTDAAERARQVAEAVHSVRMEGLDVTPEWEADADDYAAGRIDLGTFGERTRERFGLRR
ncbi:MAG: antitoxin VbhA family protein [Ornithinimicrobium sp.]|jgi:hypothetical protein|uniref:antitoxin VbhA family protein n=1 Tax=Ornithinimicrobium sp. TaxID=1977084 RepID=UPI0017DE1C9E|nr:antitoxin VbhA family protein [Actinomycetota bacterium]